VRNGVGLIDNVLEGLEGICIIFIVGLIFYIISYVIAKKIGLRLKTEDRKKISTNGIFPFMFLLLMFMIVTYTGLYTASH